MASILVGFGLIFVCFLCIFPENSTRVFVQQLITVFETFNDITQQQVTAFLGVTQIHDIPNTLNTLAVNHNKIDLLITNLVQKKRAVRRELSFNAIAPTDVSELTSLIKTLRVPIQGLGHSRAMEQNMRKAGKTVAQNMEHLKEEDVHIDDERDEQGRPRSYYGGTTDDDDDDDQDISDTVGPQFPSSNNSYSSTSSTSTFRHTRKRKTRWDDSMKVMTYWRGDYDEVLNIVKPTYLELTDACSEAVKESVKRLRRLQSLDPRYQDRPFFYKYYYRWKVGAERVEKESLEYEYARLLDPSIALFEAMKHFHQHRLIGLEKLYTKSGVPRRILFLLLKFQFNLYAYAESVYTLTSLIYELDQVRLEKKIWWPHLPFRKWFRQSNKAEEYFDLDTPCSIAEASNPTTLKKTLSKNAVPHDLEKNGRRLYEPDKPNRGHAHSPTEHHNKHPYDHGEKPNNHVNPWLQNTLDPLEYHDPDVAYPETPTQRFFYSIYTFLVRYLYTQDAIFSFRAATVVALLSLPGFLEQSFRWYEEVRGQWAVVVALIWMGPSVGSNFFG